MSSHSLHDNEHSDASQELNDPFSLHPKLVLLDSQLSQSAFYYYVSRGDGSFGWSPVKITRVVVEVGTPVMVAISTFLNVFSD